MAVYRMTGGTVSATDDDLIGSPLLTGVPPGDFDPTWITQIAVEYSEFKPAEGLTLPFASNQFQNGQLAANVNWNQILLNPKVDPKLFEKPETPK